MTRLLTIILLGFLCLWLCIIGWANAVNFGYENPALNKFKNWDFEANPSNNDWRISGATVVKVAGGNTGGSSYRVTNRATIDSGPRQTVTGLKTNANYYVSFFVKLLSNNPTKNGWSKLTVACKIGGVTRTLGKLTYQRVDNYWKQLGGDFKLTGGTSVECWVRAEPGMVTFQVDTASLIELKKQANWKTYLDNEIKKVRTNPLRVVGNLPAGCSAGSAVVKVENTRLELGVGTAVAARQFVGTSAHETNYRNLVLKLFNWAVFENDMKWKPMEKVKGNVKYGYTDAALQIFANHNFTCRGHALLWDVTATNPTWVQTQTGNTLKADAMKRIEVMMKHYKDKIEEWDVCNEYMHQHFFEERSGYRELLVEEFKRAKSYDSKPLLFLNDYEITRNSYLTSALPDLGEYLIKKSAPLGGIGIQSHLRHLPIDHEVFEKRLEIACRLNVPCTITEFSVHHTNVAIRAAGLDMAMRVFAANPKVHAIVFWGVSDSFGNFAPDYFLFQGTNFTPNAAGHALLNILKEWKTKKDISFSGNRVDTTITNAFRGNYNLKVVCAGTTKVEKNFYVGKGSNTISF